MNGEVNSKNRQLTKLLNTLVEAAKAEESNNCKAIGESADLRKAVVDAKNDIRKFIRNSKADSYMSVY